jgi:hypothetical protein
MDVSLDWKVTGSVMGVLAELSMVVAKAWFVPISSESDGAGARAMLAGTG